MEELGEQVRTRVGGERGCGGLVLLAGTVFRSCRLNPALPIIPTGLPAAASLQMRCGRPQVRCLSTSSTACPQPRRPASPCPASRQQLAPAAASWAAGPPAWTLSSSPQTPLPAQATQPCLLVTAWTCLLGPPMVAPAATSSLRPHPASPPASLRRDAQLQPTGSDVSQHVVTPRKCQPSQPASQQLSSQQSLCRPSHLSSHLVCLLKICV